MEALKKAGARSLAVRSLAVRAVQHLPQKAFREEVVTLHALVRDRIRYVRDMRGVETLHKARQIFRQKCGDCDDKAIALGALLESIGHTTRFVALGGLPGTYQHVVVQVLDEKRKKWVTLETTAPVQVGWEPRNVRARMVQG